MSSVAVESPSSDGTALTFSSILLIPSMMRSMEAISLVVVRVWMEESSPVLVSGHFWRISAASDSRVRRVWSRSWRDCLWLFAVRVTFFCLLFAILLRAFLCAMYGINK